MYVYRYGGRKGRALELELDHQLIVVRTRSRAPIRSARFKPRVRQVLAALEPVARFHDAGVDVLRIPSARLRASTEQPKVVYRRRADLIAIHGHAELPSDVEAVLSFEEPPVVVCRLGETPIPRDLLVGHASAVYALTPRGAPAVPTGLVLVRFAEGVSATRRGDMLARHGFTLVDVLPYAPGAAWVRAISGGISASLAGIPTLESLPEVVNVEPQMLRRPVRR